MLKSCRVNFFLLNVTSVLCENLVDFFPKMEIANRFCAKTLSICFQNGSTLRCWKLISFSKLEQKMCRFLYQNLVELLRKSKLRIITCTLDI